MTPARERARGRQRWARVAWSFLAEPRSRALVRLIGEQGAVAGARRLRAGQVDRREGWSARLPGLDVDALRHATQRQGITVLVPGDDGWPDSVDRLAHPPVLPLRPCDADLAALAGAASRWSGRAPPASTASGWPATSPTGSSPVGGPS